MQERVTGYFMTCDRCGKKEFITDNGAYSHIKNTASEWYQIFGVDLCPKCTEEFTGIVEKFFGDGVEVDLNR